jgi:hypothetical protein
MRRSILGLAGAMTLAVVLAVPVAAGGGWSEPFSFTNQSTVDHGCGIVEELTTVGRGRAHFDAAGTWQRDVVHFHFASTITSTVTGRSIDAMGTQNGTFTPETGTVRGQGVFIRVAGEGVVVHDTGRLVFDLADGSTLFASAKAITFDGDGLAAADAALCKLLG